MPDRFPAQDGIAKSGPGCYSNVMSKFSVADVLDLPMEDRLQLVGDIWDSIAEAPDALPLTPEDKRLLDERLEARRRNPQAGSSWQEVLARITSSRK